MHERFQFTVDVASAAHNKKLDRHFAIENSGLEASWAGERVYCTPPYSAIELWLKKPGRKRTRNWS